MAVIRQKPNSLDTNESWLTNSEIEHDSNTSTASLDSEDRQKALDRLLGDDDGDVQWQAATEDRREPIPEGINVCIYIRALTIKGAFYE